MSDALASSTPLSDTTRKNRTYGWLLAIITLAVIFTVIATVHSQFPPIPSWGWADNYGGWVHSSAASIRK